MVPGCGEWVGEHIRGKDANHHGKLRQGAQGPTQGGRRQLAEVDGHEDRGEPRGNADDEARGDEPVDARGEAQHQPAEEEDEGVDQQGAAAALLVGQNPAEDRPARPAHGEGGHGEAPFGRGVSREDDGFGGVHEARVVAHEELGDHGDQHGEEERRRHDHLGAEAEGKRVRRREDWNGSLM